MASWFSCQCVVSLPSKCQLKLPQACKVYNRAYRIIVMISEVVENYNAGFSNLDGGMQDHFDFPNYTYEAAGSFSPN